MTSDIPFEPKLGKIRAQKPKVPKSFRSKVLHAVQRAGGIRGARKSLGKQGKFGRGAGVARVMTGVPAKSAKSRRVVVKARFIKLAGKGAQAATAHLRYLQRDGVTREGQRGELYGAELDQVDAKTFMERCDGDRHQFRFIVAPEDGAQYESLKPLTRKVMSQMEQDLGTRLEWVAVDHYNTGHPHTHIVVRGRDDQGKDLVIAREYLSEGFRERVQAQVTLDLGPRSELEILATRQAEVDQQRLTAIDRQFLREANPTGRVVVAHADTVTQSLRTARLGQLQHFGLAELEADGAWRLRADTEAILRRMGERGDIIKTLHRALTEAGRAHAVTDSVVHEAEIVARGSGVSVTGRLLKRGLADEENDRHYLIVEGVDGRAHYVDVGKGEGLAPIGREAIVRLTPNVPTVRPADLTICDVAAQNEGYYSVDAHLKHDRSAGQAFAATHARRLEAIRRTTGGTEREADGRFKIGADYIERALAYEVKESRRTPMTVDVLTEKSLTSQTRFDGVTWLDKELLAGGEDGYGRTGFGGETRAALRGRMQWLQEEGLARDDATGAATFSDGMMKTLHRRELTALATQVSKETGLPFSEAQTGERVEGKLRNGVTLGAGKFAVVERGRDFTLVPWRPVLDKHIGKEISGIMREGGVNWSIGRGREASIDRD